MSNQDQHLFVTPAQAGGQGNRVVACPWVPAFAGKTIEKILRAL